MPGLSACALAARNFHAPACAATTMALSRDELRAELKRLRDLAASNGEWTMAQDAKLQSVMEGFRARLAQRTTEVAAAVSNHDQQI